ncbi:amidohydrolase family protein [Haloplanus pelagicus]|jgi:predicted TIM-barrel fold metal-dependent hydrolase|uniref:amidohydrolase family protein n=1 Tax=Haloplanus pelagicus TaxID=2949995 RepID=UPI002041301B|nr:amidohydrolase family protein [Haloplanus sp. HW8-1]
MHSTDRFSELNEVDGTVVDCDAHLLEEEEDFVGYIDDPFASMGIDADTIRKYSGHYPGPAFLNPAIESGRSTTQLEFSNTVADIAAADEMLNRDRAILTPGGCNLKLGFVHHGELAAALASAYNDWILDQFLDELPTLHGAAVVAPQKPELAAAEIRRRASEPKIASVMLPCAGVSPPLGMEKYDPIYEAAEDAGLPVMMHPGINGLIGSFPQHWRGTDRYLDAKVCCHPSEQMFHLSTMLTKGIPVKYPDLEFVIMEAGLGWIPFFIRRYEQHYLMLREDAPMLEKSPQEYIDDQFYFTSQPIEGAAEPEYIARVARLFNGSDNLLFASDWPHMDFDTTKQLYQSLGTEFDDDEVAAIYGGTARSVFDL